MQYWIKISFLKKFVNKFSKHFLWSAIIATSAALYLALFASPPDYQQGEAVRIMYIHVPSAWLSLGIYFSISLSSISYLVWRNPVSGMFIKNLIPIGMIFCGICLITGAIWGKPIWGVFWVWDARLTSVLILFFLYTGLYVLNNSIDNNDKALKAVSIVAILGSVNLPIIRFSVQWWNTLHQPASIMRLDKPALHSDILIPLMIMFLSFALIAVSILLYKIKAELLHYKASRIDYNIKELN